MEEALQEAPGGGGSRIGSRVSDVIVTQHRVVPCFPGSLVANFDSVRSVARSKHGGVYFVQCAVLDPLDNTRKQQNLRVAMKCLLRARDGRRRAPVRC